MIPPVYFGNYEYDADEQDLERAVSKFGRVRSVEYKTGFCFVHFEDKRDAEDCIKAMDGREWGRQGRRLRVEFAKNDANVRAREAARRASAEPNKTLFVAGFDPRTTRTRDVERAFEEYGKLRRCEIKKTFAFVEYDNLEDAKDACNGIHGKKINGREVTVEYVVRSGDRGAFGGGAAAGGGFGGGMMRRDDDRGRYGGYDDRGGRGGYDDRDRGRYDDRDRGRYDDRDRGRYDDRGGRGGYDDRDRDRNGDRGRDRDRSYEPKANRRSPSYSRSRSPKKERRGRSASPRRSPPRADRERERSPINGRDDGDRAPDRSRSPMKEDNNE